MLHGRERERARVMRLVHAARDGRGGALLVRGDPGVGKTALVEDVAGGVSDMTVLRTQGIESEAPLPFAALQRLLRPIMSYRERLPEPQSRALRVAVGEESGDVDRFLVFLAALSLLAEAAEDAPVLALVDDAHWLDDASQAALLFVARRLQVEPVGLVFVVRDGEDERFDAPDLAELPLKGLDLQAATALLEDRTGSAVPPEVGAQLLASTDGNPLALAELPRLLSPDQLAGQAALPGRLPVTKTMERAFLDRARRLSSAAQRLLLVASVDDSTQVRTVVAAAADLDAGQQALAEAEGSGLLAVEQGQLRMRHPLVRSAIYAAATSTDRRQAHAALAAAMSAVDDADRRAWHLAASVDVPDERVVAELDATALRAQQRGGHKAAAAAWERAAELSADEVANARRLYGAANGAWCVGDPTRARRLADAAQEVADDPLLLADIARLRARMEWHVGSAPLGQRMLLEAARDVVAYDTVRARDMAVVAAALATVSADTGTGIDPREFTSAAKTPQDNRSAALIVGLGQVRAGDLSGAGETLRPFFAATGSDAGGREDLAFGYGVAAAELGDIAAAEQYYQQMLTAARKQGAVVTVLYALTLLSTAHLLMGEWSTLAAHREEVARLVDGTRLPALGAGQLSSMVLLAALQGEDSYDRLLQDTESQLRAAGSVGNINASVADTLRWARGIRAGPRSAAGFHHLAQISHPMGRRHAGVDRIESAVGAEQHDTARLWIADLETFAAATGQSWVAAAAGHGRAVLAAALGHDDADALFEDALTSHARSPRRFDRARTELAYGEHLRRTRRRVAAREHLRAALAVFEDLRAVPWADRAAAELRASGESIRKRGSTAPITLTPQERQVAWLVQQGMSNRAVAAQLFVSPRTVEFHMRNIFTKSGVASRSELAQLSLT